MTTRDNNKRIAKNTLLLYFRMMLIMLVSLYTVRVVLNSLGMVDYGIFNVVGGVVTMFAFLSNTMASASQRFFSFELGRNATEQLKRTFSMTVTIYAILSVVILILAETIGLWFLNTHMNIPVKRMDAANWIYQFSILSFIVTIMTIPYNASIIARENMKVYAYVSIVEVLLKLLIVYLLVLFSYDKLKLYGVLIFAVTCIVTLIYRMVCIRKYKECRYRFYWEKDLFKTLISFSSWNLFGAIAGVLSNTGVNILLNIFFGPVINAARGIAFQVNNSITQFVQNFMTATRPQIVKYYATGEKDKMVKLIFQSCKFSFFLVFILSLPVLIETNFILTLWLKRIPEYVIIFTRLVIFTTLIDTFSSPLMTAAQATGKIKKYQSIVGGFRLLILPIAYLFLYLGYPPQITMTITLIMAFLSLFIRLFLLKEMIEFPIRKFISGVLSISLLVSILAYIMPLIIVLAMPESVLRFILVCLSSVIISSGLIYFIAFTTTEKAVVKNAGLKLVSRFK